MKKSVFEKTGFYEAMVILLLSVAILFYAPSLHKGESIALSPALFPMLMGMVLLGLSFVLLWQSRSKTEAPKPKSSICYQRVLLLCVLTVGYFVLLPIVHFMAATMLYLFLFIRCLGEKDLLLCTTVSVGTAIALYYIFDTLLSVRLP